MPEPGLPNRAFKQAFQWILAAEGGLVADPNDPGGLTKYGISQRAYPDLDIANLTKADAEAIYRRDYWDRCRCDEFQQQIALVLVDAAVNQGPNRAIRLLQRALGIEQDGIVGAETISAANRTPPADLIVDFLAWRATEYARLSYRYHRGWFSRLFKLHRAVWQLT